MVVEGFAQRGADAWEEIHRHEFSCNSETEWQIKIKNKESWGEGEGGRKQDGPGTSPYASKQGSTQKGARGGVDIGVSQAQRSQLEGAINGHIWEI